MKALFATAVVVASIAAAPAALGSNFITENSSSQNQVSAANAARGGSTVTGLITENSATQNRIQQPTTVIVSAPSGFQWGDAGIGAAGALGVMLLLLGGSVVILHRRDRTIATV